MKILKNNIDSFINNILKQEIKGVLLYGNDVGVIDFREKEIKDKFTHFEKIKIDLSGERTIQDVLNEIFTPSFFVDKKFLHISGMDLKQDNIEYLINSLEAFEGFVLICFKQNLDGKSLIRKVCEASKYIASIACFADEEGDLKGIISKFFTSKKITIEQDASKWILENFKDNRGVLLNELEKLSLFKTEGVVTIEDVCNVMSQDGYDGLFKKINDFFSLDIKKFLLNLEDMKIDFPASVLVSNLINYSFKLISILEEKEQTKQTFDFILNKRFIFFKQIPIMKIHLSKWNLMRLDNLLEVLMELEIEVRKNANIAYTVLIIHLLNYIEKLK